MRKERMAALHEVSEHLADVERDIDVAISSLATLNATLPALRRRIGLACEVGQGALASGATALNTLVRSRGEIVALHQELADVKIRIGLREVGVGGLGDKSPSADLGSDGVISRRAAGQPRLEA